MTTPSKKHFILTSLLVTLLLPAVGNAAFCQREITGVRLTDTGRLMLRSIDAASGTNNVLLTICNINTSMGTFQPETCSHLYTQLLGAYHTQSTISVQVRDGVLGANGLWGGTCNSMTHLADLSSAIVSIESKE